MKLEEQIVLGVEAEKVRSNQAYIHAILTLKGSALDKIQSVSMIDSDRDERDELIRKLQVVNEFEAELESLMENGQFAQNMLNSSQT